jgi:hypothetical protein
MLLLAFGTIRSIDRASASLRGPRGFVNRRALRVRQRARTVAPLSTPAKPSKSLRQSAGRAHL